MESTLPIDVVWAPIGRCSCASYTHLPYSPGVRDWSRISSYQMLSARWAPRFVAATAWTSSAIGARRLPSFEPRPAARRRSRARLPWWAAMQGATPAWSRRSLR